MAKVKFPKVLHVIQEEDGRGEEYLQIAEGGIFYVDEPDKEVAVYQLVEIGRVDIKKQFIKKGKKG